MKLELSADRPLTLDLLDDFIVDLLDAALSNQTPIVANLDGNEFKIERIELDNDLVIRIHLET